MTDLLLAELHGNGTVLILDFQYPHRIESLSVIHPRLENVMTLWMIIGWPLILRLLLDHLRILIVHLASCLLRVLLRAAWALRKKNLALHTHLWRGRLKV